MFKLKKGALSKQLSIPEKDNIKVTLLNEITRTKIPAGKRSVTIKNKVDQGPKEIKVTKLMRKRAFTAKTLKRLNKNKQNTR